MNRARVAVGSSCLVFFLLAVCSMAVTPPQIGRRTDRSSLFERNPRNLLQGFRNMYNFHVLHEPTTPYPFKAWFMGWAVEDCNRNLAGFTGCDAIFHARSRSLEGPWEVYAGEGGWDATMNPARWRPVFAPQQVYFDEWHNGDPTVVKVKGRYYMAYSSVGHDADRQPAHLPGDTDGSYLCIMGGISQDGIHWQRSTQPILAYQGEYGGSDPAGDVVLHGSYHRPSLFYDRGRFRLWFDYWTARGIAMGYAENRGDFLNPADWRVVRAGDHPCLWEFPNPDVIKIGGLYLAYGDPGGYGPHLWTSRKIVEAVSCDGLAWIVLGYLEPDADTPAIHVPEALILREHDASWLYLFYACQIGGEPYDYRYDRIRSMRRKITPEELRRYRHLCSLPPEGGLSLP